MITLTMNLLNVGDEVGMYETGSSRRYQIGVITKISTKRTRMTVQIGTALPIEFNMLSGKQMGTSSYHGKRLIEAAIAHERNAAEDKARALSRRVDAIKAALDKARPSIRGYYENITPEFKAELLALVEAL